MVTGASRNAFDYFLKPDPRIMSQNTADPGMETLSGRAWHYVTTSSIVSAIGEELQKGFW